MSVEPQWIDYNGHLNMAYYNVLFDRGADDLFEEFGIGPDYPKTRNFSTFSAEFHVCYLRELKEGDQVYVTSQLIDMDDNRFHFYQELHHEDGWLSATGAATGAAVTIGSGVRVFSAISRRNTNTFRQVVVVVRVMPWRSSLGSNSARWNSQPCRPMSFNTSSTVRAKRPSAVFTSLTLPAFDGAGTTLYS
jgi:acyl-CoA thioester hydrolase